nr:hypothetical protein [Rhizobium sp. NXC14]
MLTGIREHAAAILANFGASDAALFDAIEGKKKAEGRLPFELPSSMDEVRAQRSDVPHDSRNPLYPIGYNTGYWPFGLILRHPDLLREVRIDGPVGVVSHGRRKG